MKKINILIVLWLCTFFAYGQQSSIRLVDSLSGLPVTQATLSIVQNGALGHSDANGLVTFNLAQGTYHFLVKHLAYHQKAFSIDIPLRSTLVIKLQTNEVTLNEVKIETGYQSVPRERATGAFEVLGKKTLDLQVSTNVLDRLRNNVSGLAFNRAGIYGGRLNINLRGQSTINANTDPLVVLDNFPYDGDLAALNPDDIASVTFLKDAAAASIWGARAGNGVIVITTTKGKYNQRPKISVNTSLDLSEKPNVFFGQRMGTGDYVDIQTFLFNRGYYNNLEQNDIRNVSHTALPQVAEIWIAKRDGKISATEAEQQINQLKQMDVRQDIDRYLLQNGLNQKYALSLQGGSEKQKYYIGAGLDQNRHSQIGNELKRISLQGNQSWSFLQDKLQLNTQLLFTQRKQHNNALNYTIRDPYALLADENGNALPAPNLRSNFIAASLQKGLLDWTYRPLDDQLLLDNRTKNNDLRLNAGLDYNIGWGLSASLLYQYAQTRTDSRNFNSPESFYTRNLINTYTQINASGELSRPLPFDGILDQDNSSVTSHSLRTQLNYTYTQGKHSLTALAGYEARKSDNTGQSSRLYGYDDEHATNLIVDQLTSFPYYQQPATRNTIANRDNTTVTADRFLSYYGNAAYTFVQRYTLSASARLDQSNIFGVNTNRKGVPLYSVGASWLASGESFMASTKAIDLLKLRLTFGYNGNIDRSLSAYTTASYLNAASNGFNVLTQQRYATIQNPPNPELRWERIRVLNLGLDFGLLNHRIYGNLDLYQKNGIDLIGMLPFAPSSGIANFKGNYASTITKGIDLNLTTVNLKGTLGWQSNFLFAYVKDKVSAYQTKGTANNYLTNAAQPLEGKPLFSIYSYEWAGLEATTGNPMDYLDGVASTDYAKILAAYTPEKLVHHGSARPTHFGALRNTLSYKQLSLSFNVSYKWGYYIRRSGVTYGATFGLESGHAAYALRWQKPGDEQWTQVPSVPTANNANRDNFYTYASVLVEKGNHIRLEDINLSYNVKPSLLKKLNIGSATLFTYANNIGLLYKSAKTVKDPDYERNLYGLARSIAFGLRLGL